MALAWCPSSAVLVPGLVRPADAGLLILAARLAFYPECRGSMTNVAAASLVRPQLDCALGVVPSLAWHTTRTLPIASVS
jgi:hypothetical protein